MEKSLKFTVFADLHYKKMMYCTTVKDMDIIMERANENESKFVIHEGDFCNDYNGSPEIVNAYINNKYNTAVYGIYGNHELEGEQDDMAHITPLLTNDDKVVWGTHDGKIGDGSIGYYYFDIDGYRNICVDTNYSYNTEKEEWEHSITYCPPENNINKLALTPRQLKWLEEVLTDAAHKGLSCIVHSHAALYRGWGDTDPYLAAYDSDEVREIFARVNKIRPRTVIMQLSGHAHINRTEVVDNVFYMSVNTVINGLWKMKRTEHYSDKEYPFELGKYDEKGNLTSTEAIDISDLTMSKNTHYFESPLSADITVFGDNRIVVKGTETKWRYGVVPQKEDWVPFADIKISDSEINLE